MRSPDEFPLDEVRVSVSKFAPAYETIATYGNSPQPRVSLGAISALNGTGSVTLHDSRRFLSWLASPGRRGGGHLC